MTYFYTLYELTLAVPFPCPMLPPAPPEAVPDVTIVEGIVPRNLQAPMAGEQNWEAAPGQFLLRGGKRSGRFLIEGGERITLERNPAAENTMLSAHLLASAIAALLSQRGLLVLHANVAITPTGAIAISGESGAGKSTTLAALLDRGCTMLADDITVLRLDQDGHIVALPGVPKMSLCEDAAIKLGHDVHALPRNPLRRIKVVVPAFQGITNEPVPLKAIYQLRRYPGDKMRISAFTGAEKFAVLHECIYGPLFPEEHPGLFSLSAALTAQVNVLRIERPAIGWSLNEVVEAILHG